MTAKKPAKKTIAKAATAKAPAKTATSKASTKTATAKAPAQKKLQTKKAPTAKSTGPRPAHILARQVNSKPPEHKWSLEEKMNAAYCAAFIANNSGPKYVKTEIIEMWQI